MVKTVNMVSACLVASYFLLLHVLLVEGFHAKTSKWSRLSTMQAARGFASTKPSFPFTGKLRPGVVGPKRTVPSHIICPSYAIDGKPKKVRNRHLPEPTPPADIDLMRTAGRLAREVLDIAIRATKPGVTTDYIDQLVHEAVISRDCYPSPLNYNHYPKSCCTSVNEVICHGIPDSTVLSDGDIVNIDITVYYKGVHGDCSETVLVGNVAPEVRDLVHVTFKAFQAAVDACKPGVPYSSIGGIIEDIVVPKGYSSVREFCGHGINSMFHTSPNVLHYRNSVNYGVMAPGHTFTIEPMINLGSKGAPVTWPDDWTATTADGLPSAQFEHTLLITETGVEVLTRKLPTSPKYFWEE